MLKTLKSAFIVFIFFITQIATSEPAYNNVSDFEKGMEVYYKNRISPHPRPLNAMQAFKLLKKQIAYISESPEVLLSLNKSNPELIKLFIKNPLSGLPYSKKLENIMCYLIKNYADNIQDNTEKKDFLILKLLDNNSCFGTNYTLQLWNEMGKIQISTKDMPKTGQVKLYLKIGDSIFHDVSKLTEMIDAFNTKPYEIAENKQLYVTCLKATSEGEKRSPQFYIFRNSSSGLNKQECNFISFFRKSVKNDKLDINIKLSKLFELIGKHGGKRDRPGSSLFIKNISDTPPGVQVLVEDNEGKLHYILSFPEDKEFLSNIYIGGFYITKILYDKNEDTTGMVSLKVIPFEPEFKTFMQKEIVPIVYKYKDNFEKKFKKLELKRQQESELKGKRTIKNI